MTTTLTMLAPSYPPGSIIRLGTGRKQEWVRIVDVQNDSHLPVATLTIEPVVGWELRRYLLYLAWLRALVWVSYACWTVYHPAIDGVRWVSYWLRRRIGKGV